MSIQYRVLFFGLILTFAMVASEQSHFAWAKGKIATHSRSSSSVVAELLWIKHPCREIKGVPFRKYDSFAYDEEAKKLYGRTSETSPAVEIKDTTSVSVEAFFNSKGITAACAIAAGQPPPPRDPDERPGNNGGDFNPPKTDFVAPITQSVNSYMAPLMEMMKSQTDRTLRQKMTDLLAKPHLQKLEKDDRLVDQCPEKLDEGEVCVKQRVYTYEEARKVMMGDIDLRKTDKGEYEIFDYYCQAWKGMADFKKVTNSEADMPGPGNIVHVRLMNTEHTWPQSKFPAPKGSAANLMEKTDHHHIYPTDTKVNADRSNYEFAEVKSETAQLMKCSDGKLGTSLPIGNLPGGEKTFEPPTAHKGNVARSLFYFSVRYNVPMSAQQEAYAKKWNLEDPPDEMEKARNEKIYHTMGVRNPFVDNPALIDQL